MLTSRSPTTLGSRPPSPSSSGFAFGSSSTQLPVVLMPIGTTSYCSRSIAFRTLPAEMHEIECSLETPPNTTATRGLRLWEVIRRPRLDQLLASSASCSASSGVQLGLGEHGAHLEGHVVQRVHVCRAAVDGAHHDLDDRRSEEHTSELQSLMRISY